jgi:hypothetical protein
VLNSFKGPTVGDGMYPDTSLTEAGGDFYGTTYAGGYSYPIQKSCALGCGTYLS